MFPFTVSFIECILRSYRHSFSPAPEYISALATCMIKRSNNWLIDVYRKSLLPANLPNATWLRMCENAISHSGIPNRKCPPTAATFFFQHKEKNKKCLPCTLQSDKVTVLDFPPSKRRRFLSSIPFLSRHHGEQIAINASLHTPRRNVGRGRAGHRASPKSLPR